MTLTDAPTLTQDVKRLKSYIRSECASNNLRWRVDDPKAQYDPLVRLSAIFGRIDDWAAGFAEGVWFPSREALTAALAAALDGILVTYPPAMSARERLRDRSDLVASAAAIVAAMLPPEERP